DAILFEEDLSVVFGAEIGRSGSFACLDWARSSILWVLSSPSRFRSLTPFLFWNRLIEEAVTFGHISFLVELLEFSEYKMSVKWKDFSLALDPIIFARLIGKSGNVVLIEFFREKSFHFSFKD